MAKNILIGLKYLDREEREWQGNKITSYVPPLGLGKTYMASIWVLRAALHIGPPTNGRTKLFKLNIEIEI